MKKNTIFILIFILILPFVFIQCGGKDQIIIEKGATPKALFEKAFKMSKRHPEKARKYFREIVQLFPNSSYTPEAKYQIGYTYYRQKGFDNYLLAIQEFRDFVATYPSHPLAPQGQYLIGYCYYKMMRKPGRDQDNTYSAIKEFKRLISTYPLTPQAKKAKKLLKKCEDNAAEHIFLIGHFYYRTKGYKAAEKRFKQLIKLYPNYSYMDKVYWFLGKLYVKTQKYNLALDYFEKAAKEFFHSKYGYKSAKYLKKHKRELESKIKKEEK